MLGIPTLLHVALVWFPAIASVVLSFGRWDGIGGLSAIKWVGTDNYHQISSNYPPFWPAVQHNLIWLGFFLVIATPLGLLMAVLLDKEMKGSRIYQSALYTPVVLSLALVGFIWTLIYSQDDGLIDNLLRHPHRLARRSEHQPVGRHGRGQLEARRLHHGALPGGPQGRRHLHQGGRLRSTAPNAWQAFRYVVFPALKPVNIVVLVVTVIESLRAFDIVFIVNGGTNGLELLSVLIYNNILGEASRIGFGSAIAVILLVISLAFIVTYLFQVFRKEQES